MKQNKKAIFLDIDGTILNGKGLIPDSAKEAIMLARKNGHEVFLNTGRSLAELPDSIKELNFKGFIGSAGAYIEIANEVIFHKHFEKKTLFHAYDFLITNNVPFLVETKDSIYGLSLGVTVQKKMYQKIVKNTPEKMQSLSNLFDIITLVENIYEISDVDKIVVYSSPIPLQKLKEGLGKELVVRSNSLNIEVGINGEITELQITKASGMQIFMNRLGIKREDTIAFGDGYNDFEMLEYAGIGVAMGNGSDKLKKTADMVTDSVDQDGLYKGFQMCHII